MALKTYDTNHVGFLKSWAERYPDTKVDVLLEQIFNADKVYYPKLLQSDK